MEVCSGEYLNNRPIAGRIYYNTIINKIYICSTNNTLVALTDGGIWNEGNGFGDTDCGIDINEEWKDVTNKYCLTRKQ